MISDCDIVSYGVYLLNKDNPHGIQDLFKAVSAFVNKQEHAVKEKDYHYWHSLAEAIDSNVLICSGMRIVDYNENFKSFAGYSAHEEHSMLINKFLPDAKIIHEIFSDTRSIVETKFANATGELIPVEIKSRDLEYNGISYRLIEIRDLRNQKQIESSIEYLSKYDAVTQLPNRSYMESHLRELLGSTKKSNLVIGLIKLSAEYAYNSEVENHEVFRAKCMAAFAKKLKAEAPTDAFVAQSGVTEFAVICPDLPDVVQARLIGQQLRRQMNKSMEVDGVQVEVKTSIGLATAPEDATTQPDLMKHAALALAQARNEGVGRCKYFSTSLTLEAERRKALIEDLPKAMETGQIQTYFQPILHAGDSSVAAFEALVRWHHPDFGVIPPFEFLDIAEKQHLMTPLTEIVLSDALEASHIWPEDVRVSVNVSPQQLNSYLIEQVRDALNRTSVDPSRLEIEVTEDVIIKDFAHAASIFSRLRAMGVQVAMDDFGAGFTSLGNMRYLNFDRIKIDRIFTNDLPNHRRVAAVVRALFVLAKELDISLTVEGVETQEQRAFLRNEGHCELQGFLFSKPQPLQSLKDLSYLQINRDRLKGKIAPLIMPEKKKLVI